MNAASRINDCVVKFANVNGTGSASANTLFMKTVFRMGVPVVGKNYFPSNIQGLPTWYEVRITGAGHRARAARVDLMVAMNPETYARDLKEVAPGGWLLYDSSWPRPSLLAREDVTVLGVPLAEICNAEFEDPRTRQLMKNIMVVGVLAALLELDLEVIRGLLAETFARKPALVDAIAPEHLELCVDDPEAMLKKVRHAGAIFLGRHTPEAIGDYVAGPDHVLPTARAARYASGLSVLDFMKRTSIIGCDEKALAKLGPQAARLADAEGLPSHAKSVRVRLK